MRHIFIINPKAGPVDKSQFLYADINEACISHKLDYFIFITEYTGHATELAKRMCDFFGNEIIRFYACGGLGTLIEIINGVGDFSKAEFAIFPHGITSDFLDAFNVSKKWFLDIDALIYGEVVKIDLIKVNDLYAVNAVCCGVDARIGRDMNTGMMRFLAVVNPQLPFLIPIFKNMFAKLTQRYKIEIDGVSYDGKYSIVAVLNSSRYGGSFSPRKDAKIDDGILNSIFCGVNSFFSFVKYYNLFKNGTLHIKQPKRATAADGKSIRIRRESGLPMILNYDGEITETNCINIEVMPLAIDFVVPSKGDDY